MSKKLLVAYRVEGDIAKLMYSNNQDAAERSELIDPGEGMAVLIQDDAELKELNESLIETLKLIKAGVLKEFVINVDNVETMIERTLRTAEALSLLADLAVGDNDDGETEDDDAE